MEVVPHLEITIPINNDMNINIHIDINMNIDIHIIIHMNIEDYIRYYLLFITLSDTSCMMSIARRANYPQDLRPLSMQCSASLDVCPVPSTQATKQPPKQLCQAVWQKAITNRE